MLYNSLLKKINYINKIKIKKRITHLNIVFLLMIFIFSINGKNKQITKPTVNLINVIKEEKNFSNEKNFHITNKQIKSLLIKKIKNNLLILKKNINYFYFLNFIFTLIIMITIIIINKMFLTLKKKKENEKETEIY